MFSSKPTILYLTAKKAFYSNGRSPNSLDWNGHDFPTLFKTLKEKTGADAMRIIVGNDLSYMLALMMPKEAKPEEITAKANELIPEEITATNSAFSIQGPNEAGKNVVQVFAVSKAILEGISNSALQNKIEIEYLCPIGSVLANSVPEKDKPVLLVWSGEEKLVQFVSGGVAYGCEEIAEKDREKVIKLSDYVKDRFGLKAESVFTNTEAKDLLPAEKIEVKKISIDPVAFVVSHPLSEKDQAGLLTIKTYQTKTVPAEVSVVKEGAKLVEPSNTQPAETEKDKKPVVESALDKKDKPSIFLIVLLLLVILGSSAFFIYRYFINK